MSDPYEVLGVPRGATDDQIKDAYRRLARKYHPDNYVNNPLADLATEKMKEVNEAYDAIQQERKAGGATRGRSGAGARAYGGGSAYGGYRGTASSGFADIRRMIQLGRIAEAEELLDGIPAGRRSAEWNYLKGVVNHQKGWLDNAAGYYAAACNMEPQNQEYQMAYQRMMQQQNAGYGGMMGAGFCDVCTTLYCANLCCNCAGRGGGCY